MYHIKKIIEDGVELLPDLAYTPIWDDSYELHCTKSVRLISHLYQAIVDRENYYQQNTPNAFGNPRYQYLKGVVYGMLLAGEMEEGQDADHIIIRKGKRIVLLIDRLKRPSAYYDAVRDNNMTWDTLGF